jgi:hypothetical protein
MYRRGSLFPVKESGESRPEMVLIKEEKMGGQG